MKFFGKNVFTGLSEVKKPRFHMPLFSRKQFVFAIGFFSFFLLIVFIAWDGYIFYSSVQKTSPPEIDANPTRLVTAKQIQDVITILGERDKKSKEILGH